MSAEAVQTEILEPMQRIFLPPRQMGETQQMAALRDYVAALQGFDAGDLHAAWERVRDNHPNRSWPVPSVFVVAARGARKERIPEPAHAPRHTTDGPPPGGWERWKEISRSPLASEAIRMNVTWSLKCAVLHDGKLAHEINLREIRAGKASAERTAKAIANGDPIEHKGRWLQFTPDNAAIALRIWKVLLSRETETQAEIAMAQAGKLDGPQERMF